MRTNLSRPKLVLTATWLAVVLSAASCGGSKTDPDDGFEGRWEILDGTSTAFTLTCPGSAAQPYLQWIHLVFEHGSVTDLVENGGLNDQFGCSPAMGFDINGKTASVVNPDPYLGGPPFCDALAFNSAGDPVALLEFNPNADWSFTVSPKVAGKPPQGLLSGSASVTPFVPDATTGMLVGQPACDYSSGTGSDAFFRLTQP